MSRRKKKQDVSSDTKSVITWEERLAAEAQQASDAETAPSGGFFSLRGGVLSYDGNNMPGNEMAVIILDYIYETTYYEEAYDPDNICPPTAFAFGRNMKDMRWHETSREDFAGELCQDSDVCQWGSADVGKGKAARETRRLALIPAGTFDRRGNFEAYEDEEHFESIDMAFLRLPVMSTKGFANYVRQLAGTMSRPPHAVMTRVSVVPDAKSQFRVEFEALEKVPNELLETVMARHEEAREKIDFPYNMEVEEREEKPARRKRGRNKY